MKYLFLAVFIAAATVSCSPSTQIVKSWQEPGATIQKSAADKTLVAAPGTTTAYYGGYGRYYGYGASMYSSPGYYTTDKNYFVETMVYSIEPDKLLWTGTTKTVNPTKINKTINEIASVVSDKMKKDGFLK
jgi:hypothetical protein